MPDPMEVFYIDGPEDYVDLDFSMVNAYSGQSQAVSGNFYYVGDQVFLGGESDSDSLRAFGDDDAIFLAGLTLGQGLSGQSTGNSPTPMFADLEIFNLHTGDNILNFASTELNYGDMQVNALGGNDIIWTNIGDDVINGGAGDDIIDAGPGDDVINAGSSNDDIRGGLGSDILNGENGADILHFSADNTWSPADNGNVSYVAMYAGSPDSPIFGPRVSVSTSNQSHDFFDGGEGSNDWLVLTDGDDALFLHDPYSPFPLADPNSARIANIEFIDAGAGNDIVDLTSHDLAYGDVVILGDTGDDVLWSSSGNDLLYGEEGDDVLDGGSGNDVIYGGDDNDTLYGRAGNDDLYGEDGDDILIGGEGIDLFSVGTGIDTIVYDVFDSLLDIAGFDFQFSEDFLDISAILNFDAGDTISDFVQFAANTTGIGGTDLQVNVDGDGSGFTSIINFDTTINDPIADLINNGNLIV